MGRGISLTGIGSGSGMESKNSLEDFLEFNEEGWEVESLENLDFFIGGAEPVGEYCSELLCLVLECELSEESWDCSLEAFEFLPFVLSASAAASSPF